MRLSIVGFWCCWVVLLAGGMSYADEPLTLVPGEVSFVNDVIPLLTKHQCNAGGCHGKLAGQNGFRLSLRGYAPELDFETIAREARGRRLHLAAPEQSLLLRKALGQTPHGGGERIPANSPAERLLLDWIRQGTPGPRDEEPRLVRLEITPDQATLPPGESLSLKVTAEYDNGQRRNATWLTQFHSNDSGALEVDVDGKVTALRRGQTVVSAAFGGQVAVAVFTTPLDEPVDPSLFLPRHNLVDEHVFARLAELRIPPSPTCDEATFVRRAYLDAIGLPPTPEEVQAFLADDDPNKRALLVDQLLRRPEFVDYWAHWLGDLFQNRTERDHDVRGVKGVRAMHQWLREQVASGRNWRDLSIDLLTASGSCVEQPQVGYYIVTVGEKSIEDSDVADSVAQAFLGTRIGCARCHNHPLEKYTQDDYYHFVGFFSRIALDRHKPEEGATVLGYGTKQTVNWRKQLASQQEKLATLQAENGDAAAIEQAENAIARVEKQLADQLTAELKIRQPRTGEQLSPQPLDRSQLEIAPGDDPREALAAWITSPDNEQFRGAIVNRLWKHFLGVGLVEPVDDLRATNPPSNVPLWNALNQELAAADFDLRRIMRLIMNSRTYQLSSQTNALNVRDAKFYSHFYPRRLPAEVLLDALSQATGTPEKFEGYPLGVRAVQIPDPGAESYFLSLFGRSERTTACACERENAVTLPQLLHLQNSDNLLQKMRSPGGRFPQLLQDQPSDAAVIQQLFLATVARPPTPAEQAEIERLLASGERSEALLDLFWALLNSKEFAFNH
ncbi:DUF1549 domain-containing protein [Lignipirellula cremea]|uniref:BIG2 domain-containing protein n=1 Tax=Lignipirellula cremea TaxID=2528010 RepID=A0A518DT27_9BACT|nr:DUF1549 domain-containing protein [Lignipirellula cremea]QDU94974.1 hypothetical protein Pla8534_27830 [Lignipirellula cremea]